MARILKDFIKSSKDFDSQYDDYIEDKNHEIELNPQYQYYYDDNGNLFQVPRDNSDLVDEFGLDQPMDLSYPPSDQECESWMQFLRELHDKREAERELERKEIYGDSEDKSFSTNRINSYTGSYYKNNSRPLYVSPNEGYEYFGKDTYVNNHPENYDNYVTRKQTSYDKHSKDYWDNPKEYSGPELNMDDSSKDMSNNSINDSFEMPIEDVSFYNDNITGVAGRINTGHIKVGDSIDLNGKSYKISKINMFNKNLDEAQSGDNVEVLLEGLGRSGIRLDDSTKPNAKFAFAEYTKDTNGRLISPTQFLRSHKDMSKPEKYTWDWFEKNNIIPGRDLPSDYANKILTESDNPVEDTPDGLSKFDELLKKYYNLAESKGLLKPNQSFYNGSKWQSNTEGFTEIEDGYDYVTLTKPIDNKTLREVKYSKGKLVSDKLIKSDKDMSMLNGLFNTSFDFATRGWDYPTPYFNEIPVNNVAQYKIDSDKLTSDMFHNQLNLSKSYEDKREDLWNSLMKNKFKGKSEMDIFGYPNSDTKWSISDRPWWYSDDQGSKLKRKYERKYNRLGNKTGYFRKLDAYTDLKYNDAKSIDEKYESDLKNLITKHGGTPGTPVSYYEGGNSPDDFYNGIGFKPIPKGYKLAYNDDHHLGMIDKSGKFIKKEFSKDMSMLNGLFGKSKSSKSKYPIIQNQISTNPDKGWFYGDADPEEIKEYGFRIPEGYKARYDEDDCNPGNYYLVKKDRSDSPKVTHEQAIEAWNHLSNNDKWKFKYIPKYISQYGKELYNLDEDYLKYIDDPELDSDVVDYYNKNYK